MAVIVGVVLLLLGAIGNGNERVVKDLGQRRGRLSHHELVIDIQLVGTRQALVSSNRCSIALQSATIIGGKSMVFAGRPFRHDQRIVVAITSAGGRPRMLPCRGCGGDWSSVQTIVHQLPNGVGMKPQIFDTNHETRVRTVQILRIPLDPPLEQGGILGRDLQRLYRDGDGWVSRCVVSMARTVIGFSVVVFGNQIGTMLSYRGSLPVRLVRNLTLDKKKIKKNNGRPQQTYHHDSVRHTWYDKNDDLCYPFGIQSHDAEYGIPIQ